MNYFSRGSHIWYRFCNSSYEQKPFLWYYFLPEIIRLSVWIGFRDLSYVNMAPGSSPFQNHIISKINRMFRSQLSHNRFMIRKSKNINPISFSFETTYHEIISWSGIPDVIRNVKINTQRGTKFTKTFRSNWYHEVKSQTHQM